MNREMYISLYCLCHEEGNVYLYLPSVAGTGNCISLFTACAMNREMSTILGMSREMYIFVYCLWHEEGNVYLYVPFVTGSLKLRISLSTACGRIRELYIYLCRLPVAGSGNCVSTACGRIRELYVYLCLLPVAGSRNCMYISVYCLW